MLNAELSNEERRKLGVEEFSRAPHGGREERCVRIECAAAARRIGIWQPVLGKHHCCSAKGDDAIAIACCNAARCGLGLEQRARRGVVFIAWRIG